MKIFNLLLKNLLFLIIFLFLGDLIISYINESKSYNRTSARVLNPFFHHGFLPNRNFRHEWVKGIVIDEVINKFGFRENATDQYVEKLSEYNTVILGDSFLEGVGVENKKIVASLLPQSYSPAANLAVSSFSPTLSKERLNYFKKEGLKPKSIIHFIDISDFQDEYNYNKTEGFKTLDLRFGDNLIKFISRTPITKTFTYKSIVRTIWTLNTSKPIRNLAKIVFSLDIYANYPGGRTLFFAHRNPFNSVEEPFYFKFGKENILRQVNDIAKNNNSLYVIVIYPWPNKVDPLTNEKGYKRLESFKNELKEVLYKFDQTKFCDLTNVNFVEDDFIKNDIHWNQKGNIKVAKYISKYCL